MLRRSLLPLLCLTCALAAHAKHIYQYTDKDGVVHFTDVKPTDAQTGVKSTLVHAEARALVRSRQDGTDEDRTIVMVNESGGPITADIELQDAQGVRSEPAVLPARVVLPGLSETRVLHVVALDPKKGFRYRYRYSYLPGDYRAQPDASARYHVPFASKDQFRISQAFNGEFSHRDAGSRYAVDIMMPEGTPIAAARDGVVMSVENDYSGNGLDIDQYGDRANNVRLVHSDGTMTVYAHLQLESARAQVGEHVRAGQIIALSGDTGYTNGPHLHFAVQRNAGSEIVSIPFQFTGANGDFTPTEGMMVGSP